MNIQSANQILLDCVFYFLWCNRFCCRINDLNLTRATGTILGFLFKKTRHTCLRKNGHLRILHTLYIFLPGWNFRGHVIQPPPPFFFNEKTDAHIGKVSCLRSHSVKINATKTDEEVPKLVLQCYFTEVFHFVSFNRCLLSTSCEPGTLSGPVVVAVVAVVMEVRGRDKKKETLPAQHLAQSLAWWDVINKNVCTNKSLH